MRRRDIRPASKIGASHLSLILIAIGASTLALIVVNAALRPRVLITSKLAKPARTPIDSMSGAMRGR